MERSEAINKIKTAHKNKELGYQRGATSCSYYDPKTDSKCAIGILSVEGKPNHEVSVFCKTKEAEVGEGLEVLGIDTFHGLTLDELVGLQELHDLIITERLEAVSDELVELRVTQFEEYLFSL